jgi:hypothetical protein
MPEGNDRIDPRSGVLRGRLGLANVDAIAEARGTLWAIEHDGTVVQVDAPTGRVARRWPQLAPSAAGGTSAKLVAADDGVSVLSTSRRRSCASRPVGSRCGSRSTRPPSRCSRAVVTACGPPRATISATTTASSGSTRTPQDDADGRHRRSPAHRARRGRSHLVRDHRRRQGPAHPVLTPSGQRVAHRVLEIGVAELVAALQRSCRDRALAGGDDLGHVAVEQAHGEARDRREGGTVQGAPEGA